MSKVTRAELRWLRRDADVNYVKYVEAAKQLKRLARIKRHIARRTKYSGQARRGRVISTPPIFDIYTLYILAHECGHIKLGHLYRRNCPSKSEYEAGKWAIDTLVSIGITVPRFIRKRNRQHVAQWVETVRGYGLPVYGPAANLVRRERLDKRSLRG